MTIYQEELKRRLKEQGYGAVYDEQAETLKFYHNGIFLGEQSKSGALHYDGDIYKLQNCGYLTKEISTIATEINECVALYKKGEPMKVDVVSNYRKFVEYGDTVLAGVYDKERGFKFATWNQNEDGTYLAYGHYIDSFTRAKEDFAIRAGLINKNKVFTADQAELIFKSVNYARDNCEHITYKQDEDLEGIAERLIYGYPERDFSVMTTHFEPSGDITPKQ